MSELWDNMSRFARVAGDDVCHNPTCGPLHFLARPGMKKPPDPARMGGFAGCCPESRGGDTTEDWVEFQLNVHSAFPQPRDRVLRLPLDMHLKMQLRAVGVAGVTD